MNEVKFISYKATPADKHLGIATISVFGGKIYLRYKISNGKNGGTFPNVASYKVDEAYLPAFVIESSMMKEEIESCIKNNLNKFLTQSAQSVQESGNVFRSATPPVMNSYPEGDCPF